MDAEQLAFSGGLRIIYIAYIYIYLYAVSCAVPSSIPYLNVVPVLIAGALEHGIVYHLGQATVFQ